MKVYVVKEIRTWRYMTETRDFINDLRQADLFLNYEIAQVYCPSGCEVVEVQLMETKDLADYTKQVRKEVCEIIWGGFVGLNNINGNYEYKKFEDDFRKFLDQIEKGECECQKN